MSADGTSPLSGSRAAKTWTDPMGRTSLVQHFTATDLTTKIDTSYVYDPRGNLAQVTDAEGNNWTYTYDARGRLTESKDPDAGTGYLSYNALDQQTSTRDNQGRTQHMVYDVLGRQTELRDDSATGPMVAKWTFDTLPGAKGFPVASTRYNDGAAFTSEVTGYDTEYRPTGSKITIPTHSMTTGLAGTYSYTNTYTPTGNPESVQLPATPGGLAAEKIITRYNGEDAPVTTSGLTWYTASTSYSSFGEVLRTVSGEAPRRVWMTSLFDEHTGRLHQSVTDRETADPTRISALTYGYDTVGNITSITDTQSSTRVDRQCFAYDPMGRLAHAWTGNVGCPRSSAAQGAGPNQSGVSPSIDGGGYWHTYEFDAIGNRTKLTEHDLTNPALDDTHTYTYGKTIGGAQPGTIAQPHTLTQVESTQVTATSTIDSQSTYSYDSFGNTTNRVIDGDTQIFAWDRRNKVTSVDTDNNGTPNLKYLYDAAGNRLIEDNGTTRTLYLGEAEITVNTSGQAVDAQRYYSHPGAPTTVRATGGKTTGHKLTVLQSDHHNTANNAVEQTAGQAITRRKFDPYGNPRGTKPTTWPSRHSYLGVGIDDPLTGLTHIGAREYDPATGRFLSVDPLIDLTDPLQMNGYTYANANPITHSDPTGLIIAECGRRELDCQGGDKVTGLGPNDPGPSLTPLESATVAFITTVNLYNSDAGKVRNSKNTSEEEYDRAVREYGSAHAGVIDDAAWQMWLYGAPYEDIEYFRKYPCFFLKCNNGKPWEAAISGEIIESPFSDHKYQEAFTASLLAGAGYRLAGGTSSKVASRLQGCFTNSFTAGTMVLLADGSTKPIEEIENGDKILATDPETGETRVEEVTAEIRGKGVKNLVTVTLDTDGDKGSATATVTATDGHPFWVPALGEWVDAADLTAGQWLRTSAGTYVQVTALKPWTTPATVYNLTVSSLHTYYVLAGQTSILVHNSGGAGSPWKGDRGTQRLIGELEAKGYMIRGTEISARAATGVKIRFDVVAEKDGALHLFDAKNGPRSMFTKGQGRKGGYASIQSHGGTWYGPNAEAAGLRGSFGATDVKIAGYGGHKFSGLCR
ncbi:polymorphic toxin-type HINT domain-containing protein [Streptomyces sp. NPDC006678]|uniref:polymorphic toxin-type HINT domain-containing protein n=1 Tax=Streptomyces sp. NPDC006678 TaxID=3157185 RepID=UPI0033D799D2